MYRQLWTSVFILDRSLQIRFAVTVYLGHLGQLMQKDINVIFPRGALETKLSIEIKVVYENMYIVVYLSFEKNQVS